MVKGSHHEKKKNHLKGSQAGGEPHSTRSNTSASVNSPVPVELQQAILQAFLNAFPAILEPNKLLNELQPTLQQIKHHLYNRDFAAAFGDPLHLSAYAVRWSASRALGYLDIFRETLNLLPGDQHHIGDPIQITALGGGAGAESVALASIHRLAENPKTENFDHKRSLTAEINLTTIDMADWSPVLSSLKQALTSAPLESLQNKALADGKGFSTSAYQQDLLSPELDEMTERAIKQADLVTIMFTLNELFTSSLSRAQLLLLRLTNWMKPNALLLVVDSPGSYSVVKFGSRRDEQDGNTSEKTYPMAWLLDHTLLKRAIEVSETKPWKKIHTNESRWFRLPKAGLDYPLELENMRYQSHLYMKT